MAESSGTLGDFMNSFKLIFLSIAFWQFVFSPIALANTKFSGPESIQIVKENDHKTYLSIENYLKSNGVQDFNTIPTGNVEELKNSKQYKLTIENKDFIVTKLENDTVKIALKNKSTTLSFKDANIEQWINALSTLNINKVSFHFTDFFITDAQAMNYAVLTAVAVVLGVLAYKYFQINAPLIHATKEGKASCKDVNDAALVEKDDIKIRNSATVLSNAYAEICASKPSSEKCIEANRVLECLNNFLKPEAQQTNSPRNSKPMEGTPVQFEVPKAITVSPQ